MRGKYRPHHILEVVLLFIALAGFSTSNSKANENSKYLDAVREFADNVLKYGRDTYGKHTPLFVDGLNIHTHEPVKWIDPDGITQQLHTIRQTNESSEVKETATREGDVDLSGEWSGFESEWGLVTIQGNEGTYTDTYGPGPGKLKFQRTGSNTYSGTWGESEEQHGSMSFTVSDDGKMITGIWTVDQDSKWRPGDKGSVFWFRPTVRAQTSSLPHIGIICRNPRVYNVDYSVELSPDPNTIDRNKDLKLWVPIPREWDSQKAVEILSVQPEPNARFVDPEYGNPILFWDFGRMPEKDTYEINIRFRLQSYTLDVEVCPERVGSYDKTSKEYRLYTRSTHTVSITPKVRELAAAAIGDETNHYLQAKRIIKFVNKKVHLKILDFERGRGIECLLGYPVIDEKNGEEYYEGSCSQITALVLALCRAVGIPARSVSGYSCWEPWTKHEDLKARYAFETKLSPEGLAATQFHTALDAHMWCEFFIPNYGWIPADGQHGMIGHQNNRRWIMRKGRDIQIGPDAPQEDSEGYGTQWMTLHNGRADMGLAVLNIAKIHTSKIKILHHSDPFPADGLPYYGEMPYSVKHRRQAALSLISRFARSRTPGNLDMEQFYSENHFAREAKSVFVCDMLRRQLGDEKFFKLVDRYVTLVEESSQPISTDHFRRLAEEIYGEPLGWFFHQWVNSTELPRLRLEEVVVRKDPTDWLIQGRLVQLDNNTIFRLPMELAIYTTQDREERTVWIDGKAVEFKFHLPNEPQRLIVDPDYKVLKIQHMSSHLSLIWNDYPEYTVVYGTLDKTETNRSAAEHFAINLLGLSPEKIKADTDVNEADLKKKCVFLIGKPETNKIAQQFKDKFPVKFDGGKFTLYGVTYDKPTQGVAQIIENPLKTGCLMVMYAGLSPDATQIPWNLVLQNFSSSYVIFDGNKRLAIGDWEDVDSNLYWSRNSHASSLLPSNEL